MCITNNMYKNIYSHKSYNNTTNSLHTPAISQHRSLGIRLYMMYTICIYRYMYICTCCSCCCCCCTLNPEQQPHRRLVTTSNSGLPPRTFSDCYPREPHACLRQSTFFTSAFPVWNDKNAHTAREKQLSEHLYNIYYGSCTCARAWGARAFVVAYSPR